MDEDGGVRHARHAAACGTAHGRETSEKMMRASEETGSGPGWVCGWGGGTHRRDGVDLIGIDRRLRFMRGRTSDDRLPLRALM